MNKFQSSNASPNNEESGDTQISQAWGSLKRDHGSQPKHIRKVKLARFDPTNPPKAPKLTGAMSKFSPFDPNFWATPDVYILDDEQQYFAKKVYNEASRCVFLHVGKQNPKSIQRIRFTQYEGQKLRPLAEKVLEQIDRHERAGKSESDPLDFFKENPGRAFSFNPKKVKEFWKEEADLETCNLKIRIHFNQRSGIFEFGFLNPVSEEAAERFDNWAGPSLFFSASLMTALLTFIDEPVPV